MSDFPTQRLLETSERVAKRWKDALAAVEKAQYGPKEWLKDAFGFWTHDVGDVWLGAGTGTRTILLNNTSNKKSDKIYVNDLTKVKLTNLGLLGGAKVIQLHLDTLTFKSENAAIVQVQPPPGPVFVPPGGALVVDEQYVGLLYEDQATIATVIYLHL